MIRMKKREINPDVLNEGFRDGFMARRPTLEDNDDYMSGYRLGYLDGMRNRNQLTAEQECAKIRLNERRRHDDTIR